MNKRDEVESTASAEPSPDDHKPWTTITVKPGIKVKIDEEDLERVNKYSWRITKATTGRRRVVTSIRSAKGSRTLTLGRFLMSPPDGLQVYPRRFNADLDYRKGNLIVCTVQERQRLLPKNRKNASSQFRGVSFSKRDKKWRAAIEVKGHSINLGHYASETDAALAYNRAAREHFGAVAYQNNVKKIPSDRRK